jgi:AcrR family transcriptional regulator
VPRPAETTREKILRSAEDLFATEGIDRVTLRQIGRTAKQRNVAAVQYHFGGKDELLGEILGRHLQEIDDQRRALLDAQENAGLQDDIDALLEVLVGPLAGKLDDPSGRAYLQIQAQRPTSGTEMRPATRLMSKRIARSLGGQDADPLRDRFVVLLLFNALADRARQEENGDASRRGRGKFVESLSRAILGVYAGGSDRTAEPVS